MVVVFFGTPRFAVPTLQHVLDSSHTVAGVVTQPDRPRGRGQKVSDAPVKTLALEHNIPVLQPDRLKPPEVAEQLRAWRPDVAVVAAYGRIIPEHLLTIPRLGMINVHASLLPKYRGAAPVHRAVMNGDSETGVTIMRVVKELDAGPMFAKVTRPIGLDETSDVVEDALAGLGAQLLVAVLAQMAAGTAREEPQDDTQATYAPRLTKEEGLIDWSQSGAAIHNRVRGLYPWPHAHTFLRGTRLIIRRTQVDLAGRKAPPYERGGTVLTVEPEAIHVATGDGELAIVEVQPEGRRPMSVRDFTAGHRLAPGDVFSRS
ncbi:MAG TPA: methionyl-tRNA formyltransferase [Vicinamibacterales bacterium]|jgi:methionyl-tRNA formyltransferase